VNEQVAHQKSATGQTLVDRRRFTALLVGGIAALWGRLLCAG
jgi:hypothetical protein